ncbi:MAG TPA: HAMP domain-containing sensor histidine kinase [Solirubrobacteraceae bacterium]|jgi:two-component system sensor histidine kinase MprB|nr:HAMP domain-containing sensor histidine kinase [Solirubrobacteraceae bacterium]
MSLRRRITLISATAVTVAVVLASLLSYLLVSHRLTSELDSSLRSQARLPRGAQGAFAVPGNGPTASSNIERFLESHHLHLVTASGKPATDAQISSSLNSRPQPPELGSGARAGQVTPYRQLVQSSGSIIHAAGSTLRLPVTPTVLALAKAGAHGVVFFDARVDGVHLRVLAESGPSGYALEVARPLTDNDDTLSNLRLILLGIVVGSIALAVLLGRLIAGAAVSPVKRLTQTAELVAHTTDLSQRIEVSAGSEDELGRLAHSFNAMLDALERSMRKLDDSAQAQRQLVADASHELRTPVTSLRANVEIVQAVPDMDPDERSRILADAVSQAEELTLLMNDLIELARGDEPATEHEEVRFDELVGAVVERHQRHAPSMRFDAELEPCLVDGVPPRLDRAVSNLIDNAVKWSPPEGPVEIHLSGGELTVRDHGPGISRDDLPHVFDRFYRSADARGRPGSGLGLAIVRQAAVSHQGSVRAEAADGGGTLMRLRLPSLRPTVSMAEARPART